tara:strand:- start:136 stop:426 length:291 start_codon:yes stop_codon:yes gene_type:complete
VYVAVISDVVVIDTVPIDDVADTDVGYTMSVSVGVVTVAEPTYDVADATVGYAMSVAASGFITPVTVTVPISPTGAKLLEGVIPGMLLNPTGLNPY